MADVYNMAHALAAELRQSEEYREFKRCRDVAYEDDTNRRLLDEYKRLQLKMQASMLAGQATDEEEMRRLQQIASLLQFNADARDFLIAELRFQKMMADVYKILADTAGFDLDVLQGS
ncbi:MAG: YlbF family regulator [Christensenellales bacterium]|jgi:cell fate (sporulation/competence/biofilm development) regulator YlbF (YheA/YmcA/DUF963 family)